MFERVQRARPFEPHSYLDLARALEECGKYGMAAVQLDPGCEKEQCVRLRTGVSVFGTCKRAVSSKLEASGNRGGRCRCGMRWRKLFAARLPHPFWQGGTEFATRKFRKDAFSPTYLRADESLLKRLVRWLQVETAVEGSPMAQFAVPNELGSEGRTAGAERRESVRYSCSLITSLESVQITERNVWPAQTRDVSLLGIGLVVARRFEPGTLLVATFQSPNVAGSVTVLAHVVQANRLPSQEWLLGCRLVRELDIDEFRVLTRPVAEPVTAAAAGPRSVPSLRERLKLLALSVTARSVPAETKLHRDQTV